MDNYRQVFLKAIFFSLIFVWISSCTHSKVSSDKPSDVTQTGTIRSKDISEASGLASSNLNSAVFWVNNDSWNPASLFAINAHGDKLAELKVRGVENTDWEDLAKLNHKGVSYLVIGDVGDNDADRDHVSLLFIREPYVKDNKVNQHFSVKPDWKITFRYEDGPRDVESVAIDSVNQKILLLSKRDSVPVLYELPLVFKTKKMLIAKRLGEIKPFPRPHEAHFRILDVLGLTEWPTGMDISQDGRNLTVLTYGDAYLYTKSKLTDDWLSVMKKAPLTIPLPELKQGEAIGFDKSEQHIFITTEKLPAPVIRVDMARLNQETALLTKANQVKERVE